MVEYPRCGGMGTIDCKSCGGNGTAGDLLIGFREYSRCNGTSEVAYPNCDGTGTI